MPDQPSGQKTEKPTPRRLEKAREEGQVAKSQELISAFVLLAGAFVLYTFFGDILFSLGDKMRGFLSLEAYPLINSDNSYEILIESFIYVVRLILPILIAVGVMGIVIGFIQVGPMLNFKLLTPKLSKVNPIEGVKRLFSLKSLMELAKSVAKSAVIIIITYRQLSGEWSNLITLSEQGLQPAVLFIANLLLRIIINIMIFMIVIGIADYIYQRWEYLRNLKMTKKEVKDEHKEMEGDPLIKSKRREIQRQMSMNRMISAVEEADVVISNPTHIAVALQYDLDSMEAPLVVAKGEGYVAEKIKETAREFDIEIVENKPLARALNQTTKLGEEIPPDLYQAVAEVIAFLYRSNNKKF